MWGKEAGIPLPSLFQFKNVRFSQRDPRVLFYCRKSLSHATRKIEVQILSLPINTETLTTYLITPRHPSALE